jgi:hypothetical protein
MNDHLDRNDLGAHSPYRILLQHLTGTQLHRPRLKTAVNVWRRTHRDQIEAEVRKRAVASGWDKKKLAPLREKIAKDIFSKLSNETKEEWDRLAKEEHAQSLEQYTKDVTSRPATDPASRQRYVHVPFFFLCMVLKSLLSCIQGLAQFVTPILDLICEATGWKASLITGGPEPARGGSLNVLW